MSSIKKILYIVTPCHVNIRILWLEFQAGYKRGGYKRGQAIYSYFFDTKPSRAVRAILGMLISSFSFKIENQHLFDSIFDKKGVYYLPVPFSPLARYQRFRVFIMK